MFQVPCSMMYPMDLDALKKNSKTAYLMTEYERLSRLDKPRHVRKETVTEQDVLRWSREAKTLKKLGKLPVLESLKEFRNIK